ncbi:MAG TPA: M42 family metallopeptidase [Peptococcaceae bacterium]|nr:M42 family metallopeptidase [Peptococcaceae bacterium]
MTENILSDYRMLKELTQKFGPSGNEKEVSDYIAAQIHPLVDKVESDPLGNLVAHRKGSGLRVMIACHMDEVGVMITHIDERGYLYFSPVGGLISSELVNKRVIFQNKRIGIVCKDKEKSGERTTEKIYIDIGASRESEARKVVKEGDMAVLVGDYVETDNCIISKALDNRLACFLVIEFLKHIQSKHELYIVFTCQEEVGARGAKTAAYSIRPDLALVIDATRSYDRPQESNQTCLDRGVAIKAMDKSIIVSPQIKNWMAEMARKKKIEHQWEVISTGSTDSGPVHLTAGGIPTGGLALPVRYLHTGNEVASKKDLNSALKLLAELVLNPFTR